MFRWPARFARMLLTLVLAAAVTAALAGAPPVRAQSSPDLSVVDAIMTRLMPMYDIPGAAVALIQNGKIILTKGYGYRDVAARAPVTEHTLFNIGSITKSFTALGIAQLVDQGKLDLDTPVVKYVPELRLADPQVTKTVTLRHLLSHTSGLPRANYVDAANASRKQVINDMVKLRVTAKPGERFQYSNHNFVLAGYVVEKTTGQSWEGYTREHILAPLGMSSARFDFEDMWKGPDFARPYLPDVLLDVAPMPLTDRVFKWVHQLGPAGSIDVSVLDMARYALFQLGDGTVEGRRIVSRGMLAEMHRRQVALKTSPEGQLFQAASLSDDMGYGFGWLTEDYRGIHLVQHNGEFVGFTADVTLVPSSRVGVVVLTNTNDAGAFIDAARLNLVEWLLDLSPRNDIATEINNRWRVVFGFDRDRHKSRVASARAYKSAPAELARWTGDYDGPFGKARITAANDRLLVQVNLAGLGEFMEELIPFAADSYLVNHVPFDRGTTASFKADEDGVVTLYEDGAPQANRVGRAGRSGEYADPLGHFHIMAPAGVRLKREGSLLVFRSATPAMLIVTSTEADKAGLDATVDRFVARALPQYDQKVTRRHDLGSLPGRQSVYALPMGDLLVIEAVQGRDRVFLTALFGNPDAIQALIPVSTFIALSFKAVP